MKDFINTLEGLEPARTKLLGLLSKQMSDQDLLQIAEADYGYNSDELWEELKQIRDTLVLPSEPSAMLDEVLQLTRWSRFDEENIRVRLYACILLIAVEPYNSYTSGIHCTLARLLESVLYLDDEYKIAAIQLLAWFIVERYHQDIVYNIKDEEEDVYDIDIDDTDVIFALIILLNDLGNQSEVLVKVLGFLDKISKKYNQDIESLLSLDSGFIYKQNIGIWKRIVTNNTKECPSKLKRWSDEIIEL